jgi:copper chaperone CopZ
MNKLILILILTLLSTFAFAEKIIVEVPGMVCQMCVQGMQKNFQTVVENPQKDVIVDLDKKTVTVTLKEKISEKEIKKRVADAGYNAKKITWVE